jgi:hypothetical protein
MFWSTDLVKVIGLPISAKENCKQERHMAAKIKTKRKILLQSDMTKPLQ